MLPTIETYTIEDGQTVYIRPFRPEDREATIEVWRAAGLLHPNNDPHKDIDRKSRHSPEGFLLCELEGQVIGTVMAGYEGHRGWINYLGVLPALQRRGVATLLMHCAERRLRSWGCAKINLQIRTSNTQVNAFYEAIGYSTDDCISKGKRLEIDGPP